MPRDLSSLVKEDKISNMPPYSKAHNDAKADSKAKEEPAFFRSMITADDKDGEYDEDDKINILVSQRNEKRDALHPYTQSLSISDLESCIRLEDAAFPPNERCTREKFQYRFKHCSELTLGIFTSQDIKSGDPTTLPTLPTSQPVYTGAPARKAVLLAHIIATKTSNQTVTDADMSLPVASHPEAGGHQEAGRTVCIHSLAVLPEFQRRGLGTTLLRAYLQRLEAAGVADRVALLAHGALVGFYERAGFRSLGESKAEFGGGGWVDMVLEFSGKGEGM